MRAPKICFLAPFITLIVSLMFMAIYLGGMLKGNINYFMLPAKMFGVPLELQQHGIKPLYTDEKNCGWDGQFYYYISNDLLGLKDTAKHIDAPSYRYQRVGLPFLSKIISLIMLQKWVAPMTYYLTNILILCLASFFLAKFYEINGGRWYYVLFWSLGFGVQLTLLNALPDGAAEGLFILAALAYLQRRLGLYTILILLTALTREIYIIAAAVIGILELYYDYRINSNLRLVIQKNFKKYVLLILPGLIFLAWRIYIVRHFHATPSSQAFNIMDVPMRSLIQYLALNIKGALATHTIKNYLEVFSLCVFIFLVFFSMLLIIFAFFKKYFPRANRIVLYSSLPILIFSLFFGSTVMFDYTGYLKAINICYFIIPFYFVSQQKSLGKFLSILFLFVTIVYFHFLYDRASPELPLVQYTPNIDSGKSFPCLEHYQTRLKILSVKNYFQDNIFRILLRRPPVWLVQVQVTNLSSGQLNPGFSQGAVNVSYQYLRSSSDSRVIQDGMRTFLAHSLRPGESLMQQMLIEGPFNRAASKGILRLTLVQEGCSWFYLKGDKGYIDLHSSNFQKN